MLSELTNRKEMLNSQVINSEKFWDRRRLDSKSDIVSDCKKIRVSKLQFLLELDAARESERQRLARELHDQMGQEIVALSLGLKSLKKHLINTPEIDTHLEQLQLIIGQLNQQVHNIAWELRPSILDDLGLKEALLHLVDKWSANTNIIIDFRWSKLNESTLTQLIKTEVYRIVQESLINIIKHAKANKAVIAITRLNSCLTMHVSDNGCGFNNALIDSYHSESEKKSFGLIGIIERVKLLSGTFDIISSPESGTILNINIPLSIGSKR